MLVAQMTFFCKMVTNSLTNPPLIYGFYLLNCKFDIYMLVRVIYTHANAGYSHAHDILHFTVIYFVLYDPRYT